MRALNGNGEKCLKARPRVIGVVGALVCGVLFSSLSANGQANELIRFNTTSNAPLATPAQNGYQDLITEEAFRRLGMRVSIKILPGERALLNLNRGLDDGTAVRIPGLEKKYKNLRMVPEEVMDWVFVAFTRRADIQIKNWADLAPYTVAYINGWKIFEQSTRGLKYLTTVQNADQLFELLTSNRSDIILFEKWQGLRRLQEQDLRGVRLLEPPLATRKMFFYLHKRRASLIPRLSAALKSMKADGFYKTAFDRTLLPYEKYERN